KELVVWVAKIAAAVAAGGIALLALGAAISGVGAALGMIATVAAGIGSAFAALLTPIGLVSAGVVALAAYLLYATGVGEQALRWLSGVFTELKNDALAAFQGIADALAAGDIGLAAKVLWLTLKMEWQKGVHALREIWVGFKEIFLSVWTEAVFGLSRIMTSAWAGLQSIWTETVAAMSTAWTVFASGAVSAWKTAQNFIAKGIVRLMGLLDSSVDVDATLAALNEDFQREQEARQRDTAQQLAGIESARQQRLGEIEAQRAGTLAALDEDRRRAHEDRQKRLGDELDQSAAALAAAQKEWADAVAEARKKGSAARSAVPERGRRAELDLAGLDEVIDATQRKVEAAGTFNPFAIGGLGADSLSQRTAKASEEIAANTRRLLHEAQHGKLVFA
ncbi:MAG: hypothetical protein N2439_08270, partial [Anaerolineae bacterium]|nr:hypothetical protein [Anaerolineae bacterium]